MAELEPSLELVALWMGMNHWESTGAISSKTEGGSYQQLLAWLGGIVPKEAIQQKPKGICLKMFSAVLVRQKNWKERKKKELSTQWAILAIYPGDSHDVANSVEKVRGMKLTLHHTVSPEGWLTGTISLGPSARKLCVSLGQLPCFYLQFYISAGWPCFPFSFDCQEAPNQIHGPSLTLYDGVLQSIIPGFIFFPSSHFLFVNNLVVLYAIFVNSWRKISLEWNGVERKKERYGKRKLNENSWEENDLQTNLKCLQIQLKSSNSASLL